MSLPLLKLNYYVSHGVASRDHCGETATHKVRGHSDFSKSIVRFCKFKMSRHPQNVWKQSQVDDKATCATSFDVCVFFEEKLVVALLLRRISKRLISQLRGERWFQQENSAEILYRRL